MSGYNWEPFIKLVPQDGVDSELDIKQLFPDSEGFNEVRLVWSHLEETREDVNRELQQDSFGFRADIRLQLEIIDMAAHQTLMDIVSALIDPDVQVLLSLNGNGAAAIFREIVLDRTASPRPINGKTVVGAVFELRVSTKTPLAQQPVIAEGGTVGAW